MAGPMTLQQIETRIIRDDAAARGQPLLYSLAELGEWLNRRSGR